MLFKKIIIVSVISLSVFPVVSCATSGKGNSGQLQSFPTPSLEAKWILDGEPIEFEGEFWYPQDGIESLLDSEVLYKGTYQNVQFFVDKLDVRPYKRLYTKFDKNKFRYYKRQRAE
ncbi:MAG: hypothetical protein KC684_09190 [Candidatus Omnitrophica bacterium]|nr:hypothetical protein [Candidatus Omnitrophota bacterium]